MAQTKNQQRAAHAVAAWMAQHEWNNTHLVTKADADPGTIGDFLNGKRWPKIGTQGRIEKALGWTPGTLRSIALGGPAPDFSTTVGGSHDDENHDDSLRFRRPAGLSDEQWGQIKDKVRGIIEWQIELTVRER